MQACALATTWSCSSAASRCRSSPWIQRRCVWQGASGGGGRLWGGGRAASASWGARGLPGKVPRERLERSRAHLPFFADDVTTCVGRADDDDMPCRAVQVPTAALIRAAIMAEAKRRGVEDSIREEPPARLQGVVPPNRGALWCWCWCMPIARGTDWPQEGGQHRMPCAHVCMCRAARGQLCRTLRSTGGMLFPASSCTPSASPFTVPTPGPAPASALRPPSCSAPAAGHGARRHGQGGGQRAHAAAAGA